MSYLDDAVASVDIEALEKMMRTKPCSEINDAFARLILRDCACGSTLAAVIEIYDLSEE